ncbi:MAG: efflux RND transporter periplasmic adaptor subunit [Pseudomonadota bacterium]|nr:efflux RND transporter periplasmic adaptor subunit [Pseudomonadota bacterium]
MIVKPQRSCLFPLILVISSLAWSTGRAAEDHAHKSPAATTSHAAPQDHDHHDHAENPEGPHGGRLLIGHGLTLEITVYERGVPAEFRVYPYRDGKPIDPTTVDLTVELARLGGQIDRYTFLPEGNYLRGEGEVSEPHSFDVTVHARAGGEHYHWAYASHEGRVTIPQRIAEQAGITTASAQSGSIRETVRLYGRVVPVTTQVHPVRARFPGVVRSVHKQVGDSVKVGERLLTIEADASLRNYTLESPIAGEVTDRMANPGEIAGDQTLMTVTDLSTVWADLAVFPEQADRIRVGQQVRLQAGGAVTESTITYRSPIGRPGPATIARVTLDNTQRIWPTGQWLEAEVVVSDAPAELIVDNRALQRFRDFTVVFAKFGDTYEVRMVELGRRDAHMSEVLSGLKPGTEYVVGNSYLIKADIEKSGASHEH